MKVLAVADVTRQYLNQVKRNIQGSEAFICITFHGVNKGYKISSNLNAVGQIKLITDAGEHIRREALRYIPQEEEAQDETHGLLDARGRPTEEG